MLQRSRCHHARLGHLSVLLALTACGGDDGRAAGPDASVDVADAGPKSPDASVEATAWVTTFGSAADERVIDVDIDDGGNVAVIGSYQGELSIGDEALRPGESGGALVARFAPDGELSWARALDDGAHPAAIATDAGGNLYVAGTFEGSVDFGDGAVVAESIDGFLVSFTADGGTRWSVTFGGLGFDGAFDVAVGGSTLAITGEFQAVVDFGNDQLTSAGLLRDAFVATYATSGEPGWAIGFGGDDDGDRGAALAVGSDGSIAVAGVCNGDVNFGELAQTTDVSPDAFDLFVVVYGPEAGMPLSFGRYGAGSLMPRAIAIAPEGSALVAGWFDGVADFGDHQVESAGSRDGFLVNFDAEGQSAWARQLGGVAIDEAASIAVVGDDVLVTGYVSNEVDLGGGPEDSMTNVFDLFWARYQRSNGDHVDSGRLRPDELLDGMEGTAVAVGPAGQIVLAGDFEGSGAVDGEAISSSGETDGFILQRLP